MKPADIEAGMRLKKAAQWNQISNDWAGFLELAPRGCFVAEKGDYVVGTATGIRYDAKLGWIGMVLVDPEHRRQGIATCLMSQAIDYLESSPCQCLKLDATGAGARVYSEMGFSTEYQVERWIRKEHTQNFGSDPDSEVKLITGRAMKTLGHWDSAFFGADRSRLLEWYLFSSYPAFWSGQLSSPRGFVLCRPGSSAYQIGPLTAVDYRCARTLFSRALDVLPRGPLIADIVVPNQEAISMLESFGFERFRILQRMYRGENASPGQVQNIFCMAGFEFG